MEDGSTDLGEGLMRRRFLKRTGGAAIGTAMAFQLGLAHAGVTGNSDVLIKLVSVSGGFAVEKHGLFADPDYYTLAASLFAKAGAKDLATLVGQCRESWDVTVKGSSTAWFRVTDVKHWQLIPYVWTGSPQVTATIADGSFQICRQGEGIIPAGGAIAGATKVGTIGEDVWAGHTEHGPGGAAARRGPRTHKVDVNCNLSSDNVGDAATVTVRAHMKSLLNPGAGAFGNTGNQLNQGAFVDVTTTVPAANRWLETDAFLEMTFALCAC